MISRACGNPGHMMNMVHIKKINSNNPTLLQTVKDRGSYRSAHVLLNLLNKLGKSDKM